MLLYSGSEMAATGLSSNAVISNKSNFSEKGSVWVYGSRGYSLVAGSPVSKSLRQLVKCLQNKRPRETKATAQLIFLFPSSPRPQPMKYFPPQVR